MDEEDGDIDSDIALGESDSEKFKKFAFRGSSKPAVPIGHKPRPTAADYMTDSESEKLLGGNQSEGSEADENKFEDNEVGTGDVAVKSFRKSDDEDEDDHGEQSEDENEEDENEKSESGSDDASGDEDSRAELKKIMNEEEKTVVATISQAAKADADKGAAVKQQRKTFDSMLNTRMVLQKGVVAINSIISIVDMEGEGIGDEVYQGAEEAAIKLWNILNGMRQNLIKASNDGKTGQKRKRAIDSLTSSDKIWERMQALEVASIDSRQMTLEKWWVKAKGPSASLTGKLNNNATPMSLTSVIQDHLAKSESLERTKRPRSCAPVQEKLKVIIDPNIYDDTTLYKTLLNQLVDQRKMDLGVLEAGTTGPAQWAVKEAKMRKVVDKKASKGRKLRFTVHEKLQNFMAPEERGSWEPQAIDRFFGTLLGQKMTLREDVNVDNDVEELAPGAQGLRLFA